MDHACPAGPSRTSSSVSTDPSSSDDRRLESRQSETMSSAPTIWFPLNENVSSSWPPKITFGPSRTSSAREKSSRSLHTPSTDAMEGVITSHPRTGHTRSATRPIPNRATRSNSLNVPATPTSLWREISDPKGFTRGLVGSGPCPGAPPINLRRIRPSPSLIDIDPKATPCPSRHDRHDAPCGPRPPLLPLPPPSPPSPSPSSTGSEHSVLTKWQQNERTFLQLWSAQKRNNPHLPVIVSPLNPLRAFMPPLHWQFINVKRRPFQKTQWNFTKPLPSPALRPKLRSRKACDAASERLSAKAIFTGKFRPHCRLCSQDTLLKRLLLFNHWVARVDLIFESALLLIKPDDDDYEMGDAPVDDDFPQAVFLKDRDDFDDDDLTMDEDPLIAERHADSYALRLF
ncbi:hypothetical protein DFH09DRAFT_585600 [Mycena vulgaris]|nr:hypothetical protein DFH09DRAFT_585600 [Mycena vulgaris]